MGSTDGPAMNVATTSEKTYAVGHGKLIGSRPSFALNA
jgi:hypothetical protein